MWSIIITSVSGTPHGVSSRSCRPQEKGIVTEVGAEQRRQSTLNSGKTRPCFPAESAHYKRQYKSFPQVSTTPWPQREWMERTKAWAKPQRQIPNLANKHQPWDCQLRTQMYTWSVLFFSPLLFCSHSTQTVGTWSHYSCCSESSAKGTKKKKWKNTSGRITHGHQATCCRCMCLLINTYWAANVKLMVALWGEMSESPQSLIDSPAVDESP